MIEALKEIDRDWFLALNGAHTPFWDSVMYWASHKWVWVPLYVILFILVFIQYRRRTGLVMVFTALLILCTDQSANLFKNNLVQRYRPCHNYDLKDHIHVNGDCGGKYGFVSSHAANTFGLAIFLLFLFRHKLRFAGVALLIWAFFVSYSRIYNGVHFPFDIIGGALLGSALGWLFYRFFKKAEMKIFQQS